jgi:hypothetical protein
LDQLHPSRRRGACQDLVRAIGEYALKFAGTDGAVTEAQMRALSAGRTWRVTQGYLDLLLGVGALRHDSQGTYTLLYFLDENPSVAARAAFARRQREQATPRKQRERSRTKVESTSNQQISDTKNNVLSTTCIERHAESTNHQEGAKAATHLPTPRRPGVIPPPELEAICDALANPWDKYLQAGQGTDQGVAAMDVTPAKVALPTKRGPRKKAHRCIPARISDDPAPVNEHSVVTVFRELGLTVDTVRVRDTLLKLRARGAREATVRYALHCVKARRGKVRIDNPISYLMSIVENQQTATLASVAG